MSAALGNCGQGGSTPVDVFDRVGRADSAGAGALVLSRTEMRIVAALGEPVVSSNRARVLAVPQHLGMLRGSVRRGRLFGDVVSA